MMDFRVITAYSVSEALAHGLHHLTLAGGAQPSRVGDVLVSSCPVVTVYKKPMNRVLFSPMRDANPFFHLMESLWMLAGRNDLDWPAQFNKRMTSYSDDGGITQPGAYGYRWRRYFGYDQLETIIVELKHNPTTRRCVLAMWDGGQPVDEDGRSIMADNKVERADLLTAISGGNDVPCNTHAYFDMIDGKLNMTVCNRSNDIVWGAYGANAVHFSFLLEYVAAATGLPMGVYRQISNNYHLYTNVVGSEQMMPMSRDVEASDKYFDGKYADRALIKLRQVPLLDGCDDSSHFQERLAYFLNESTHGNQGFFGKVAEHMFKAWRAHKAKNYDEAQTHARAIVADDWRIACTEWLERRRVKYELNNERFTDVVVVPEREVTDGNA